MKTEIYERINTLIIDQLEKGTVPWVKPWRGAACAPKNLLSGKNYRGVNAMLTSLAAAHHGTPYFVTYKQSQTLGGQVRSGEKGLPIVFWNFLPDKSDVEGKKVIPFLRYYTVFNVAQCDGIEIPKQDDKPLPFNPVESAEKIVANMPGRPKIEHGGNRAFYRPSDDHVQMPRHEDFKSSSGYYSTLFHELGHSTGHISRLKRPELEQIAAFGSHTHSKEELIAEMTAAFLCAHSDIDNTIQQLAAYIQSWLSVLKDTKNKTWLISAAGKAQKAADYILNQKPESEE